MESENIALRHEAIWTLAAKVVLAVFGFGGVILFARVLGAAGLGTYYFGLALVMLTTRISTGIGTAVKKRTSETRSDPGTLLWTGLLLHIGVAIGSVLVFLSLSPWLSGFVGGTLEVKVLAISVAVMGWFFVTKNAYEGLGRPSKGVWADAIRMVVTFAAQIVFLWLDYGVLGLFAGLVIGSLVVTIAMYIFTSVTVTPSREPDFEAILGFARWSVPNNVMEDLHDRLDIIILTVLAGSSAAGVYEAAKRLTVPGVMVSLSVAEPLVVKVSGLNSQGRSEDVRENLEQAVAYAGIVAVPLLFGALAMGNPLMLSVYGDDFGGMGLVLAALALFQVFQVYRFPFRAATDGINQPDTNFRVNAVTVAINLGLSLSLVWDYGVLGVAVATVLTESLRFVFYQYLASTELGGSVTPNPLSSQLVAGVAMYALIRGVIHIPGISVWEPMILFLLIGVGGLVYFTLLIAIDHEIRQLAKVTIRNRTII